PTGCSRWPCASPSGPPTGRSSGPCSSGCGRRPAARAWRRPCAASSTRPPSTPAPTTTRRCCWPRGSPPVPKPRLLYDHRGEAVRLGAPLASGGEGTAFTLAGDPTRLAKLYHRPPDADKVAKLSHMTGAADAELTRVAAWPTATLHDSRGGLLVGFLMP